jgi:hypothetical protein
MKAPSAKQSLEAPPLMRNGEQASAALKDGDGPEDAVS